MKISVFGLGYVGTVSAACLAELGHDVTGVDIDAFKVDAINSGAGPIVEDLIGELVQDMVKAGRLRAINSVEEAIHQSSLSLICVGTPSTDKGGLETRYVERVAEQIGEALRSVEDYHVVVLRSTILPGTMRRIVIPALERASGKKEGKDFGVCFHPEFLREGTSVRDFHDPPKIVIGSGDECATGMLASLYKDFTAPLFITSIEVAEMVKYADNTFHALKVAFGNEIGALCKTIEVDSHEVMRIFCQDKKLNISPAYLMPGFAFGGSCLPKDLRALMFLARSQHINLPVLANVIPSNEAHIERTVEFLLGLGKRRIGMLGLSFKAGTDDLRESPLVELVERLLGKGCTIRIHDENVSIARLRGGNKAYIEQKLPHVSELLCESMTEVMTSSEIIIIGASSPEFRQAIMEHGEDLIVLDLVHLFDKAPKGVKAYHGVCW